MKALEYVLKMFYTTYDQREVQVDILNRRKNEKKIDEEKKRNFCCCRASPSSASRESLWTSLFPSRLLI